MAATWRVDWREWKPHKHSGPQFTHLQGGEKNPRAQGPGKGRETVPRSFLGAGAAGRDAEGRVSGLVGWPVAGSPSNPTGQAWGLRPTAEPAVARRDGRWAAPGLSAL